MVVCLGEEAREREVGSFADIPSKAILEPQPLTPTPRFASHLPQTEQLPARARSETLVLNKPFLTVSYLKDLVTVMRS